MPTNFILGHVLIWLARDEVCRSHKFLTRPLLLAWCYSLFVFVPVTAWAFYSHLAWSTVYLRPESQIPFWAGPAILSCYFLGMVIGSSLGQSLLQLARPKAFAGSLLVGIAWLGIILALTFKEYLYVGSYDEFHSGTAKLLTEVPGFQLELNVMGLLIAMPGLALAVYLKTTRPR